MRYLERAHPAVCFLYMLAVLSVTVFSRSPVVIAISLCTALVTAIICERTKGILLLFICALAAALINPLFSHAGSTALIFIGDAAYTLEAFVYGAVFGLMLVAAFLWGMSGTRFLTSDKYIWLFGRALPSAGLVLSCAMRFVPLFVRRTREFVSLRSQEGIRGFLKGFMSALSYSAEEAMLSANSMSSRGYKSAKRTFYSLYRFTKRDLAALILIAISGGGALVLSIIGAGDFFFYPTLSQIPHSGADIALYCNFCLLCLLPAVSFLFEEITFRAAR